MEEAKASRIINPKINILVGIICQIKVVVTKVTNLNFIRMGSPRNHCADSFSHLRDALKEMLALFIIQKINKSTI